MAGTRYPPGRYRALGAAALAATLWIATPVHGRGAERADEITLARALIVDHGLNQLCSPMPVPAHSTVIEVHRAWRSCNARAVTRAAERLAGPDAADAHSGGTARVVQPDRDAIEARIEAEFMRLSARYFPEDRGDDVRCTAFLAKVESGALDVAVPAALDDVDVD